MRETADFARLPEWPDDPAASWEELSDVPQTIGDPIILTAAATIAPTADASPNLASLTNPYGLPMELLEARISVYPINGTTSGYTNIPGLGLSVKADLGKIAVIDSGVPISGMSNYRDVVDPLAQSTILLTPATVSVMSVETYTWRLKYPLFIPGGTTLNLTFTNKAIVPYDARVVVTYHCRVMKRGYKPKRLMVPWVCSFDSKAFNVAPSEGVDGDESSEMDLVNPFGVPLEISRMIGGYANILAGVGVGFNLASEASSPAQPREFTYVNMRSSQGDDLVFTQTPFEALWPSAWRAWDLPDGTQLEPGEWLKLQLTRTALDYSPTAASIGRVLFSVTMTGYREIGGDEFNEAAGG